MFTGLAEEIGTISGKRASGNGLRFTVSAKKIMDDLAIGDSVSINGVCQTVTAISGNTFEFDTVEETLSKTTMSSFVQNTPVNLERALQLNARLGGHFVLGHIDCTGSVIKVNKLSTSYDVSIQFPVEYERYIIPVGSIAVDGVSLTVAELHNNIFKAAIIPHSWNETIFGNYRAGNLVNLEFDVLGKYVEKMLCAGDKKKPITEQWLRELGY